jgi:mannose-6-phosphate isomerase-like protein (cupin superfamily)
MPEDPKDVRARRVVMGVDDQGRSTIVSDGYTETRLMTPAWTLNHLWESETVPSDVMAENTLTNEAVILPPPGGYKYMVTTYHPDSTWDYDAGYGQALAAGGAGESLVEGDIPGLHATDTVDIVTIISGELWAVSETGETLLQPGDTFVQRGTKHTWQNRGDVPAVAVAIMIGATRKS